MQPYHALFSPTTAEFTWTPEVHNSLYGKRSEFLREPSPLGPSPTDDSAFASFYKESMHSKLFHIIAKRLGVVVSNSDEEAASKKGYVEYVEANPELALLSPADAMEDYLGQYDPLCVETYLKNRMELYHIEYTTDIYELFKQWKNDFPKKPAVRMCKLLDKFCDECGELFTHQ
jgi:hypothetical protein